MEQAPAVIIDYYLAQDISDEQNALRPTESLVKEATDLTESDQEIIQQTQEVIDRLRLRFLIRGVNIGQNMHDIPGQPKRLQEADAYVTLYPDGAVITQNPHFMSSEVRKKLTAHEIGHVIDPETNPFLLQLFSPSDYVALGKNARSAKTSFWQNYFLRDTVISSVEARVRWEQAVLVGEKFWPLLLSQISGIDVNSDKTFVLPKNNLEVFLPDDSVFQKVVLLINNLPSNSTSQWFSAEELGRGLLFLFQNQTEIFNDERFSEQNREFLKEHATEINKEFFAEYFSAFFDDETLTIKFPELHQTWLELQAILAVAATQSIPLLPAPYY